MIFLHVINLRKIKIPDIFISSLGIKISGIALFLDDRINLFFYSLLCNAVYVVYHKII